MKYFDDHFTSGKKWMLDSMTIWIIISFIKLFDCHAIWFSYMLIYLVINRSIKCVQMSKSIRYEPLWHVLDSYSVPCLIAIGSRIWVHIMSFTKSLLSDKNGSFLSTNKMTSCLLTIRYLMYRVKYMIICFLIFSDSWFFPSPNYSTTVNK